MAQHIIARLGIFLLCIGIGACETSSNANNSPSQTAASSKACTLATPLKPGIPGSPDNPIKSDINPNGDSELSHLMRKMLKDLQKIRPSILAQSKTIPPVQGHERIRCSWPSDPGIRGPLFGALSDTYLSSLKFFESTAPTNDSYNGVVAACLGCHNSFCPGPIHLIQNLWIEGPGDSSP